MRHCDEFPTPLTDSAPLFWGSRAKAAFSERERARERASERQREETCEAMIRTRMFHCLAQKPLATGWRNSSAECSSTQSWLGLAVCPEAQSETAIRMHRELKSRSVYFLNLHYEGKADCYSVTLGCCSLSVIIRHFIWAPVQQSSALVPVTSTGIGLGRVWVLD